jgi:hypothetical protein
MCGLLTVALTVLVLFSRFGVAAADIMVVVKNGDWIDYKATVTGTPNPPNNVTGATVNFTDVQGTVMHMDVVTIFANGTPWAEKVTLNLTEGVLGDDFVIPINLNVGDQFFDRNQGNITITSMGTLTIAGAQRQVVSAHAAITTYYWDRATGVLVMANSTNPTFEMDTAMVGTNIWQPTPAAAWYGQTAFFLAVAIAVVVVVAAAAVLLARKRAKRSEPT